jgi:hypothetical protein
MPRIGRLLRCICRRRQRTDRRPGESQQPCWEDANPYPASSLPPRSATEIAWRSHRRCLESNPIYLAFLLALLWPACTQAVLDQTTPAPPGNLIDVGGRQLHLYGTGAIRHLPRLLTSSPSRARSEWSLLGVRSRIGRAHCRARRSRGFNSDPEHFGMALFRQQV